MEENAWEVVCRKVRLGGRWDGGRLVGGRMKENACEGGMEDDLLGGSYRRECVGSGMKEG